MEEAATPIIDGPAELAELAAALKSADRIALDVEGDGLYRYRARLCTLQVAWPERFAVVDTLAAEDLEPLATVLGPDGPVKVVHDASFDAKMLAGRGLALSGIWDTSVAARFLGERATGLSALVEKYLGHRLDKGPQQADWGARPLEPEGVRYLVDDVRYLLELSAVLEAKAREQDIVEEIDEEGRYVLARAVVPEPQREPWTRIKGARDLRSRQLALLVALSAARERVASERDVPPFRVAGNRALLAAAKTGARSPEALSRVRGLHRLPAASLREALEQAGGAPPPAEPAPAPPPPEVRARRKAREKALLSWRATEAARRGVNEQVVLPGHCLRELGALSAASRDVVGSVPGLGAKRLSLYGEALVGVLQGAEGDD